MQQQEKDGGPVDARMDGNCKLFDDPFKCCTVFRETVSGGDVKQPMGIIGCAGSSERVGQRDAG